MKKPLIFAASLALSLIPCGGQIINGGAGSVTNEGVNAAIAADPALTRNAITPAANAVPVPLNITGPYVGVGETHPSVVEIPELLSGYRYWMAYTPYPSIPQENPSILCSNDKITWAPPSGLTNPIDTNAAAVGLGYSGWSDTEIVWDGTTLHCFYRSVAGAGGDVLYRKTSLDGVTWSARAQVLTGTGNTLMSPSIVIEDNGDWMMFACDQTSGLVDRYRSTDGGATWAPDATASCAMPSVFIWHASVKKHMGIYYLLMNSTVAIGRELTMLWSTDGITFDSECVPFLPKFGASDSGGYYRSTFLPRGGYPPMFDVWWVGISGDIQGSNPGGIIHRLHFSEIGFKGPENLLTDQKTTNIEINDYFWNGNTAATTGDRVGDLGWRFVNGSGTGWAEPGLEDSSVGSPFLGALQIRAGASSGNISGIQRNKGGNVSGAAPFLFMDLTRMSNFSMVWYVLCKGSGTSGALAAGDEFWLGIGSQALASTPPGRWVGFKAAQGTANWQAYYDDTPVSPTETDMFSSLTNSSIRRLELGYKNGKWRFRVGYSRSWIEISNAIAGSNNCNISAWVRTGTGGVQGASMQIFRFHMSGTNAQR